MRLFIPVAVVVVGWASGSLAAAPAALTSLSAIHDLNNARASQGLPVAFEATVTYFRGYDHLLFVQDGGVAIFVRTPEDDKLIPGNLVPGDRVLAGGTTQESFRPIVVGSSITRLYHGAPPGSVSADIDELIRARHDCMLVTVRGVVRAADMVLNSASGMTNVRLQLEADGGHFQADVNSQDELALSEFLDAEVAMFRRGLPHRIPRPARLGEHRYRHVSRGRHYPGQPVHGGRQRDVPRQAPPPGR
jgi:hypothetical protein